jgi:GDP-L-fucose synthase
MNVLVLGGHGFVGKVAVRDLTAQGHRVTAVSRKDGVDLTHWDKTLEAFKRAEPEAIINCAAHVGSLHYVSQYAAAVIDDNVQMLLNVFRATQQVAPKARLIHPISNCSYPGDANVHAEPSFWDGPVHRSVWSYGNSRRMIGVLSDCYAAQYRLNLVNFFAPNAYGPGDYTDPNKTHALNGMIIRMLQAQAKGETTFEIWGTGKPEREWIYVEDLARMLVDAVQFPQPQVLAINIAQNRAYSIRETAELIKTALGYTGDLVFNTTYQDGAMRKILDDAAFRAKYPDFRFTAFAQGIQNTVNYYRQTLGGKS